MLELLETFVGFALFFLLPLWLFLHYRFKTAKARSGLSDEDMQRLESAQQRAEYLENRLRVLESILDQRAPDWKRYL